MLEEDLRRSPVCLTVPGLGGSGPGHWQTLWEKERHDCERIELGCWDEPIRNVWISRIDQAVGAAQAPVVLVAHSLGCLAVAWWASLLGEAAAGPVKGALLVAPPDVNRASDARLGRFGPCPRTILPFPSIVVASHDDPYSSFERSREMASDWLSDFVDAGEVGHINAQSGLGAWTDGQHLLELLIDGGPGLSRYPSALAPSAWKPRAAAMRPALGA